MSVRVAINGFGRIGRNVMRNALSHKEVEVVAINDRMDPKLMSFLFKHDSVHGPYAADVSYDQDSIIVGEKRIHALAITDDLLNLPWSDLKVDVVLECTGIFRTGQGGQTYPGWGKEGHYFSPGEKGGCHTRSRC